MTEWTLPELVRECATRIAALPAPSNGQVRAVPDERTVRYYGTLGLLDRPAAMRGRTALYTERHLAQVVAIKRLQTMGRSLAEIQALWPSLDDLALTRMSGVAVATARPAPAKREEFWKRDPSDASTRDVDSLSARRGESVGEIADATRRGESVDGESADAMLRDESVDGESADAMRRGESVDGRLGDALRRGETRSRSVDAAAPPASVSPAYDVQAHLRASSAQLTITVELARDVTLAIPLPAGAVVSDADVRAIRAAAAPLLRELTQRRLL